MKRRLFSVVACFGLVFFSSHAVAGGANSNLKCKSSAPRQKVTALQGSIPGDFAEFNLLLKHGKKRLYFKDKKGYTISVISRLEHKVFTLSLFMPDEAPMTLYALPRSVKYKQGENGAFKASFNAVLLLAPKPGIRPPRNTAADYLQDVKMKCSIDYSI